VIVISNKRLDYIEFKLDINPALLSYRILYLKYEDVDLIGAILTRRKETLGIKFMN